MLTFGEFNQYLSYRKKLYHLYIKVKKTHLFYRSHMTTKNLTLLLLLFSTVYTPLSHAGKIIRGSVSDSVTGEILPAAHIRVMGTRTGTITNDDGEFSLELDFLPAEILINYIGYNSRKITITGDSPDALNIELVPSPVLMETVVVTADDEAFRIMEKVIKRKQEWRAVLESYKVDAYSRIILENDKEIVSIAESISEIFWDREKGNREVMKSKRQTNNITENENFAFSEDIINFYDDDIDIIGYKVFGPTHPDALKYYDFRLKGRRWIDDRIVYDISVNPGSKLQPLFVGTISVLDEDYAMIAVDLIPCEAILFPRPINEMNLSFKQQFSNFGQTVWLPVDFRFSCEIKIKFPGLRFPTIKISKLTRLTDYEVNIAMPDTLFKKVKKTVAVNISNKSVTVNLDTDESNTYESVYDESKSPDGKSDTVKPANGYPDSLFADNPGVIPLTEDEKEAYSTIDSTMTIEKAFKPEGFLAKILIKNDKEKKSGEKSKRREAVSRFLSPFSPQFSHNRVDAFNIGLNYNNKIKKKFTYKLAGSYLTGPGRWSYGGEANYKLGRGRKGFLSLNYSTGTMIRYHSDNYPAFMNSMQTLFARDDYFDYFWNNKISATAGYRFSKIKTSVSAGINDEIHRSASKTTDYNVLGSDKVQRENPSVREGRLRSIVINVAYGDEFIPFGLIGQKRAELKIEHSSPDFLSSDFAFTRYMITLDWRIKTFLKRRLLPNAFDIRLIGGTFSGELPVQRFGTIDGTLNFFSSFGAFRTLRDHPLEGEQYCALFWEHNFRTVPFELIGLQRFAKKGLGIIIHGSTGRTWISEKRLAQLPYRPYYNDGIYNEIGLSLNALFGFFRLDVTKRLDKHGVFAGLGITRMF
ncbi:MAG TPA: carboxypeptidase-like regulatory domain-containing protein [bacterium]|nr:carboxypeptidase-like regulatory domain-containing protein [bacterium]